MASYEQALEESIKYFNNDDMAAGIFVGKYALTDGKGDLKELTPDDMHKRLAREFARIEKKYPNPMSEEEIYDLFKDFKYIVPQGSPMSAIGNDYQIQSASNCFVLPPVLDSYGSILQTDEHLIQISKRRGGNGLDISNIRPQGVVTNNASKTTDGIGVFMERYSNSIREVGQSGRRGALIITISVHHPEIKKFINIKKDMKKVTGANISIRLSDEFMNAVKNDIEYEQRWPIDSKTPTIRNMVRAKDIWDEIVTAAWQSAEPGLLFWDTITRNTPADIYKDFGFKSVSTNPCFGGDTLIAVADGRNYVSIKQLAEEGRDVPVYSYNKETGLVSIKMGRNPRITGYDKELIRVYLDDETFVDVTEDHKFYLLDGTEKLAKDLTRGDSLPRFTKELDKVKKEGKDYYRVHCDVFNQNKLKIFEHRLIAKFFHEKEWETLYSELKNNGFTNTGGVVVHHVDYNSLNNSPDNLRVMSFSDHTKLHGDKDNNGENNGRFSGVSHEQIEEHALNLTKELNRRFSVTEWRTYARKNNIPVAFSKWRKDNLGGLLELGKKCCDKLGIKYSDVDPRLSETFNSMEEQGYNCKIEDHKVLVEKHCELCKDEFWIEYSHREQSYCSQQCSVKYISTNTEWKNKQHMGIAEFYKNKQLQVTNSQLKIYSDLKFKLGRDPLCKEWEIECKNNGISYRIGHVLKNGFHSYKELKLAGNNFNHKVLRLEKVKKETVYNITVDDNHTIGLITKKILNNKKEHYTGIFTPQCGEINLSSFDSCRLLILNLFSFIENPFTEKAKFNYKKFDEYTMKAQKLMDDLVDIELEQIDKILNKISKDPEPDDIKRTEYELWLKIKKACTDGRRTGLGITSLGDALAGLNIIYGSDESIKVTEKIYKHLAINSHKSSVILAKDRGAFPVFSYELEKDHEYLNNIYKNFDEDLYKMYKKYGRRNIALTTTAPTGSVSTLTQTTSGIEPAFLLEYFRKKKINSNDKFTRTDFVDAMGDKWQEFKVYHHKYKMWMDITGKSKVEDSPYYKATSNDVDWLASVKIQAAAQKFIDHSISKTCNLPKTATKELVSEIYMTAWESGCKGFTIYRDGCRDGVLTSEASSGNNKDKFQDHTAPKRPNSLECDIHHATIKGESWTILVGKLDGKPYEIFGGLSKFVHLPKKTSNAHIVKRSKKTNGSSIYDLTYIEDGIEEVKIIEDIVDIFHNPTEGAFTRTLSLALRHGCPVQYVVEQLQKDEKDSDMYSFSRVIARVLKQHVKDGIKSGDCPECKVSKMIYKEGCLGCPNCGYSKC